MGFFILHNKEHLKTLFQQFKQRIMKKIFTLLIALVALTSAFAQSGYGDQPYKKYNDRSYTYNQQMDHSNTNSYDQNDYQRGDYESHDRNNYGRNNDRYYRRGDVRHEYDNRYNDYSRDRSIYYERGR